MAKKRKKKTNRLVGKIGWCSGQTLGLSRGHFVFIRRVYKDKCSVNTLSSIKKTNGSYNYKHVQQIEDGTLYPIPNKDTTLRRFGGIHKNVIKNVPVDEIQDIGKYRVKRRHHHYIQKYMKK